MSIARHKSTTRGREATQGGFKIPRREKAALSESATSTARRDVIVPHDIRLNIHQTKSVLREFVKTLAQSFLLRPSVVKC